MNLDFATTTGLIEKYVSPYHIWGALFYLGLLVALGFILTSSLRAFVSLTLAKDRFGLFDRTTAMFLKQLGVAFIWVALLVVYAHLIPALRNLGTAMLAGVSVVGVVVGLAAQNTLGNLIAGVSLLIYRPFKVGDRLQVEAPTGVEVGTVEILSLGYTTLKTLDNRRVVVPNSVAATRVIVNLSTADHRALATIPITLDRNADIAKVRSILLELATNIPQVLETGSCPVTRVKAQQVELTLRLWCREHDAIPKVKSELIEQAASRFAKESLEIGIG